jgi:hypothetical protein
MTIGQVSQHLADLWSLAVRAPWTESPGAL